MVASAPSRTWVPLSAKVVDSKEYREFGWTFPSIALVLFSTVSPLTSYLPHLMQVFPPAVILLGWWALTGYRARPEPNRLDLLWALASCCLLAWLLFRTVYSVSPNSSIRWSFGLVLGAVAPIWAGRRIGRHTYLLLRRTFLVLGLTIGIGSCAEQILHFNPFSGFYARTAISSVQHWSVYRSQATFSHPLIDGTFLAAASTFSFFAAVEEPRQTRWLPLSACVASSAGLLCTVSRSCIVAAAVGIALGMVPLVLGGRSRPGVKLLVLSGVSLGAYLISRFPLLANRSDSTEARQSSIYRESVYTLAPQVASLYGDLGSGAGTSGKIVSNLGYKYLIESSPLQLLISIGVPGLATLLMFLALPILMALRERNLGAAAALVAFVVSSSGFEYWESNPNAFALFGLLGLLCWRPSATREVV
ncbi:O-antigen ligase like membrane protein [Frankia torreyi]|uniref:O-antigen ligase like membrane protein n=1 Tax=Frankia torreyi TaxID=1856 RepID=A0A0D8BM47_9ACTN|nr:O-antigen ligase like membrane protein [Frankia torreyi]